MLATGRADDGIDELRTAVAIADELGSPFGRWQSRGALGTALYSTGDDDGAAAAHGEASDLIRTIAASLSPEHQKTFLTAPAVEEALKPGG